MQSTLFTKLTISEEANLLMLYKIITKKHFYIKILIQKCRIPILSLINLLKYKLYKNLIWLAWLYL